MLQTLYHQGFRSDSFELVFADATGGANPVSGYIFKSGAWSNAAVRVANSRVIFVTTHSADVLSHSHDLHLNFQKDSTTFLRISNSGFSSQVSTINTGTR